MNVTGYPEFAIYNTSLPQDARPNAAPHDEAYSGNSYAMPHHYELDPYLDVETCFDQRHTPMEISSGFRAESHHSESPTTSAAAMPTVDNISAFRSRSTSSISGQFEQYLSDLSFHPMLLASNEQTYLPTRRLYFVTNIITMRRRAATCNELSLTRSPGSDEHLALFVHISTLHINAHAV